MNARLFRFSVREGRRRRTKTVRALAQPMRRRDLAELLGKVVSYASGVATGQPIGSTRTLARFVARVGPERVNLLATLHEWYPDEFAQAEDEADRETQGVVDA